MSSKFRNAITRTYSSIGRLESIYELEQKAVSNGCFYFKKIPATDLVVKGKI